MKKLLLIFSVFYLLLFAGCETEEAELQIIFEPTEGTCKWDTEDSTYEVTIEELNGVPVTLDYFTVNGKDYSDKIESWFDSDYISANGEISTGLVSSFNDMPQDGSTQFKFEGNDENNHRVVVESIFYYSVDEESKAKIQDINIVDISDESYWDYCVIGTEDYYFIKTSGNLPEAVLFHSEDTGYDYSIFFTNDGFLDKVCVEDYIVSFKNPDGNKIDIGIIDPDGNIEILREVETDYDWDNYELKSASSIEAWSDVIRWTGRIVSGVPCALSVYAAIATSGVGTPLALWACGNYLLGLSADIMENEFEVYNGFTAYMTVQGAQSTMASCSGLDLWVECASDLASRGFSAWADHREEIEENRKDDVHLLDAALEYGYGDIQITLTWDNGNDLDLHVIDPNGEEIYFSNPRSESNGILDVDDRNGYGPENIYWETNTALSGTYQVYIHYYSGSSSSNSSNYKVLINAFGLTKTFTGSITYDETIHITDFDQNGLKSSTLKSSSIITTRKDKNKNTKYVFSLRDSNKDLSYDAMQSKMAASVRCIKK